MKDALILYIDFKQSNNFSDIIIISNSSIIKIGTVTENICRSVHATHFFHHKCQSIQRLVTTQN